MVVFISDVYPGIVGINVEVLPLRLSYLVSVVRKLVVVVLWVGRHSQRRLCPISLVIIEDRGIGVILISVIKVFLLWDTGLKAFSVIHFTYIKDSSLIFIIHIFFLNFAVYFINFLFFNLFNVFFLYLLLILVF
jgi:hypothetical protein